MSRGFWEKKLSSLPCANLAIFMILAWTHVLSVQLDALSAKAAPSVLSVYRAILLRATTHVCPAQLNALFAKTPPSVLCAYRAILLRATTHVCPAQLDALFAKTPPFVLCARRTILLKTTPVCSFQPMYPFQTMLEGKKPFLRSFLSACYKTMASPSSTGFRAGGRFCPSSPSSSTSTSSGSTSTTRGTTGS